MAYNEYISKKLDKTNLPVYDNFATCKKCGSKKISAHYEKESDVICRSERHLPAGHYIYGEHIDRYCTNCGYAWAEAPINTE